MAVALQMQQVSAPLSLSREECPAMDAMVEIVADADPLVLCRITQMLALSDCVPRSFVCVLAANGTLRVSALVEGMTLKAADIVRRKLMQLTCVVSLDVAPKERDGS
jgi:hypothetical protein